MITRGKKLESVPEENLALYAWYADCSMYVGHSRIERNGTTDIMDLVVLVELPQQKEARNFLKKRGGKNDLHLNIFCS